MEVAVKSKKEGFLGRLLNGRSNAAGVCADECENFAYRRTLLFYANDCKYCRYAQKVTGDASGHPDYLCTFSAQNIPNEAE